MWLRAGQNRPIHNFSSNIYMYLGEDYMWFVMSDHNSPIISQCLHSFMLNCRRVMALFTGSPFIDWFVCVGCIFTFFANNLCIQSTIWWFSSRNVNENTTEGRTLFFA